MIKLSRKEKKSYLDGSEISNDNDVMSVFSLVSCDCMIMIYNVIITTDFSDF